MVSYFFASFLGFVHAADTSLILNFQAQTNSDVATEIDKITLTIASNSEKAVIKAIVKALNDGADVSSGSRFIGEVGTPKGMGRLHYFGNRFLSKVSSIRNGRKISDLCTGLWGFQRDAINKIQLNSKGFDLEAEIAGKIRKSNLSHVEVGIKWSARKGGMGKLKSFRDGSMILLRIIRT